MFRTKKKKKTSSYIWNKVLGEFVGTNAEVVAIICIKKAALAVTARVQGQC